ncbi:MAG TPA: hypothetical protein VHQ01_07875, partial [Pyrinomonadaceae bacterium]|nr:hypothetical protein [Pyrinomonadaceae bacterium]
KSQIYEAFQGFSSRFESSHEFDQSFRELVLQHLEIARDEGAKLSANAFEEAQKMEAANAPEPLNFAELRDAISDISSKDSQSAILKTLVEHASKFAPRGAFFIIKNENFAGWKVFGEDAETAETAVRDIHFPTSADSIIGKATASGATVEGSYGANSDDSEFLTPLQFGQPDRMVAIPLVARGRGVAVMYADHGTAGGPVNLEALETIVRVAALTVELLASSHAAKTEDHQAPTADFESTQFDAEAAVAESPFAPSFAEPIEEYPAQEQPVAEESVPDFSFSESVSYQSGFPAEPAFNEPAAEYAFEPKEEVEETPQRVEASFEQTPVVETPAAEEAPYFQAEEPAPVAEEAAVERIPEFESNDSAMVFDSGGSIEPAAVEKSPFDRTVEPFEPAAAIGSGGAGRAQTVESAIEVSPASMPQARLSDRPVDLPIEVPEEERRLHNDARRFARLLVSEIKLYNEKKVLEGRQSHDLYDRLREALDRSREMYDKRVQPPVAARFDYFHYELLNSLAEGNADRFGANYPGATI